MLGQEDKSWIIEVSMIQPQDDECVISPIVVEIVQSGTNPWTNQPTDRLSPSHTTIKTYTHTHTHRHILIFTRRVDPEKCFTTLWPVSLSERRCSLILCISTLNHPIH